MSDNLIINCGMDVDTINNGATFYITGGFVLPVRRTMPAEQTLCAGRGYLA